MTHFIVKPVALATTLLMALGLTACNNANNSKPADGSTASGTATTANISEPTLDKIKKSGEIVVGYRDSSIPFSYIGDKPNEPIGYAHDLEMKIVAAVKNISVYKLEITDYLDIIMIWYRDVLLYKATKEIDKVVFKDQLQSIKEQARKSSYEGIELILESLEKAKARLKANVNFDLVMELLFLTIKEN